MGEVVLLAIIALVVVGPRNLPQAMRTIGRTISRLKRMTIDIREQTGIDEILKAEGIQKEMDQLRALASGRILDMDLDDDLRRHAPPRWREFPRIGADSYGALADDETMYAPMKPEPKPPELAGPNEPPVEAKVDAPVERRTKSAPVDPFAEKDAVNADEPPPVAPIADAEAAKVPT